MYLEIPSVLFPAAPERPNVPEQLQAFVLRQSLNDYF